MLDEDEKPFDVSEGFNANEDGEEYHRGILIIKSSIENEQKKEEAEEPAAGDKKEQHDHKGEEEAKGGEEAVAKNQTVSMKYFRTYLGQWKKPLNTRMMLYETSFEIKMTAVEEAGAA